VTITPGVVVVKKPEFGSLVNRETIGRKIFWDTKKFELASAYLRIAADQSANAGASLSIVHNDKKLTPVIRWEAFDTNNKSQIYDVSDILTNGENIFDFVYEVGAANVLGFECQVDAFISLEFTPLTTDASSDSTPAEKSGATDEQWWSKFVKSVEGNLKVIAIIIASGAVIIGIGYIYLKKQSWITSIMSRFAR
jgi:hypothetical protein